MVIRAAGLFRGIANMKRLYGIWEAGMLLLVGLAALWFALSPHYSLLINPRFKWITVTGAVLVLGMGIVGPSGSDPVPSRELRSTFLKEYERQFSGR